MSGKRENNPNWGGGKIKKDGYIYLYRPEHPKAQTPTHNGYIAEHVLVMEKSLGRYLLEGEVVHHIDGIRSNNLEANLKEFSISEHTRFHRQGTMTYIDLICAYCGEPFKRAARNVNTKLKNGQVYFYCNRSCAAKHFGRGRKKVKVVK